MSHSSLLSNPYTVLTTGACDIFLEVLAATEFIAIVTHGDGEPHVVGTWGEYVRKLDPSAETIIIPAGGYHQTEANLGNDDRIKLLIASRHVRGSHGPGQACEVIGTAKLITEGQVVNDVRRHFPWARGALVISVLRINSQL